MKKIWVSFKIIASLVFSVWWTSIVSVYEGNVYVWFAIATLYFLLVFFFLHFSAKTLFQVKGYFQAKSAKKAIGMIFAWIALLALTLIFLLIPGLVVSCFALPVEHNVKNKITGRETTTQVSCGHQLPWYYEDLGWTNPQITF